MSKFPKGEAVSLGLGKGARWSKEDSYGEVGSNFSDTGRNLAKFICYFDTNNKYYLIIS
jgi:hypothetical protein